MRISDRQRFEGALSSLNLTTSRVDRAQRQIHTGLRIERASDDPIAAAMVTRTRAAVAELDSYSNAIDDAEAWMGVTETAVQSTVDLLNRARSLVTQAVNGAQGSGSREAIATELEGIRDQLVTLANTSYLDRPVFGGFSNAAVQKTGSVVAYVGTTGAQVQRRISSEDVVVVNTDGEAVFGFTGGDSVFAVLQRVADAARSGDVTALNASTGALEARAQTFRDTLGAVGARTSRILSTRTEGQDRRAAFEARRSQLQDADLAESATELAQAQRSYEATLAAISRLSSTSLLDFLR